MPYYVRITFAGALRSIAVAALVLASAATSAQTAQFPSRPIRIIVPYSGGTGSDIVARTVGQSIAEKTRQNVVVENRDGGGSLVGTMAAAKSTPDGYTILIAANPFVIVPSQRSDPPYDPLKDFIPIAKVAIIPLVLAAASNLPVTTVKDLVAHVKANPGKLSYASSGPGTISQQEMELFKQAAGLNIVEVGYKSTAQAMTDLLGGHIPLFPVVVPSVLPQLSTGRLRVLGVFDSRRSPLLPDVPPIGEELGIPGYVPTPVWYGFVAPAGTPRAAADALHKLVREAMDSSEVKDRLSKLGAQPINPTNQQFLTELKSEVEKAAKMARALGTAR